VTAIPPCVYTDFDNLFIDVYMPMTWGNCKPYDLNPDVPPVTGKGNFLIPLTPPEEE